MTNIYFIGGSPCSGKSTIAEILAEKFGACFELGKQHENVKVIQNKGEVIRGNNIIDGNLSGIYRFGITGFIIWSGMAGNLYGV